MRLRTLLLLVACIPGCLLASDTVDYVVVGCGTAGAVMTRRLNDHHNASVVTLHNGPNLIKDPIIACAKNAPLTVLSALLGEIDPAISPLYESGTSTDDILWAVGIPGGGASSINAGAYTRGDNASYQLWETLAGSNWSVSRILGIFKEIETYKGQTPNPALRGEDGPVTVRQDPYPGRVSEVFTQAWINATGFPSVLDFNDPETPVGISSQLQYTQDGPDGDCRVSSEVAFLGPGIIDQKGQGLNGRQIDVRFNATALRTLWNGTTAIGVEYLQDGETKQVFARKGVVVCGGLLSSPFLMHSGIGPVATLTALGIPVVVANSNVGQNLVDQPLVVLGFTTDPADFNPNAPGIFQQICWLPTPTGDQSLREWIFAVTNPIPGLAVMVANILQPTSRGEITISSADPTVPPVVTLDELSSTADQDLYIEAFQIYIKNLTTALAAISPAYQLVVPDPSILNNSAAIKAYVTHNVMSNQSFQGHCRMAPLIEGGVVDGSGLVYGTTNLYVADASICPSPLGGTPMAPAMMIAYNIAELITADQQWSPNGHVSHSDNRPRH
jgi:choline dehydrogenase-like flavoprotein